MRRALIRTMEQHRQLVLGIAVDDDRAAARSLVIALRDGDEVAGIDHARTTAEIGRPLDHIAGWLRTHHPIPLASLVACTIPACMNADFYATAWAFFAFPTDQLDHELASSPRRSRAGRAPG